MHFTRLWIVLLAFCLFGTATADSRQQSWPIPEWQAASPQSVGMSAQKLEEVKSYLESKGTRACVIVRHGKIVSEWYWDETQPDTALDVYSITKSVFGTAIGILIDDRKIKLSDSASRWIPEWRNDGRKEITIWNLINMNSGLDGKNPGLEFHPDRLTMVLRQPLLHPPGSRFEYNSFAFDALSTIVRKASGKEGSEFLRQRIFEPIGIRMAHFKHFSGKTERSGLLHISARELARFGYLFLREGRWNKKQIISKDWITKVSRTSQEPNKYYSHAWWVNTPGQFPLDDRGLPHGWKDLPRDAYCAPGKWGNNLTIIPSYDLVIVRLIGEGKQEPGPTEINVYSQMILQSINADCCSD